MNKTNQVMRRLLATFLLVCLGIMIPLAASPIRVCILDMQTLSVGFPDLGPTTEQESNCCSDCGETHKECCSELKQLPDSTLPSGHLELPILAVADLPRLHFIPHLIPLVGQRAFHPSISIRGPDTPSAHRAVLSIWRI